MEALVFETPAGQCRPLTISVGIACTAGLPIGADALLRAADQALYAAKRNGRNRVEIAPVPNGA